VFGHKNRTREFTQNIVLHSKFDPFILVCIVLSTILLTLENPLDDPKGQKADILYQIDLVVTIIFILECALKVLTFGFLFCGPDSYIKNPWNVIDFTIVIFSVSKQF
jgi:hypothetical protein